VVGNKKAAPKTIPSPLPILQDIHVLIVAQLRIYSIAKSPLDALVKKIGEQLTEAARLSAKLQPDLQDIQVLIFVATSNLL
jgi:hypothetical protein